MKYPIELSKHIDEVLKIVKEWPVEKDLTQVLNWLMQFDSEDIDIGVRIIKNLNVIGFEDLNKALTIAYSKLERVAIDKGTKITNRNTLFAGIGDAAKSGAMIGYNFRIINELPEDNFLTKDSLEALENGNIDNIVLIDDIVGTGQQAIKEIKELTEKILPFSVKNIFLLTAVGMKEGIDAIKANTEAYVFSAFEYSELDTIKSLDSIFYDGIAYEKREYVRKRIEYYGRITNSAALGYGGVGALIAFYYNTPNISLPIIWGSKNSWIPLFKRAVKINGINSYYKQFDSSIKKNKKEKNIPKSKESIYTLFVEGKSDEIFFDYIISNIKPKLNFQKVNTVSLGGFGSKKLIDNITVFNENYLFIIEDDQSTKQFINNIGNKPYLTVKSFIHYLNISTLYEDENYSFIFSNLEGIPLENLLIDENLMRKLEREIYFRITRMETKKIDLFDKHLDKEKINLLEVELIEKINGKSEDIIC